MSFAKDGELGRDGDGGVVEEAAAAAGVLIGVGGGVGWSGCVWERGVVRVEVGEVTAGWPEGV